MAADHQLVPADQSQLIEQRQLGDEALVADQLLTQGDKSNDGCGCDAPERTEEPNTYFASRHEPAFGSEDCGSVNRARRGGYTEVERQARMIVPREKA